MRRDMSKVIVERPRFGSGWRTWRRKGRYDPKLVLIDEEGEEDPSMAGLRSFWRARKSSLHSKWLNENLAPLRRFLMAQVGRPWDAVWSEICENLKPTSTVQQHVRDHISDFVAMQTSLKDGRIYFTRPGDPPFPLDAPSRQLLLYVDPLTGVLRLNPHFERYARRRRRLDAAAANELATRFRRLPGRVECLVYLDDGNWWEVKLANAEVVSRRRALGAAEVIDVIEQAGLSALPRDKRYGNGSLVATAKRPLSKRELKQYGLREA